MGKEGEREDGEGEEGEEVGRGRGWGETADNFFEEEERRSQLGRL